MVSREGNFAVKFALFYARARPIVLEKLIAAPFTRVGSQVQSLPRPPLFKDLRGALSLV